jgi:choline dehydrogenase-like flavoprotein
MNRRKVLVGMSAVAGVAAIGASGLLLRKRSSKSKNPAISYTGSFASLSELPEPADFDVCIIGSGPAGALLAQEMLARKARVVILEAVRPGGQSSSGYSTLSKCRSSGTANYPVETTRVLGPGGTSAICTGRCPRLWPMDFERNAYTPEGSAWPLSYADIEPYYARAETVLHVNGEVPPEPRPPSVRSLFGSIHPKRTRHRRSPRPIAH